MGMKSMLRRMLNFLRMVKRALFAPVKPMGLEDAFPAEAEGGGPEGHGSASDEGVLVWVPSEARGEDAGKPPPRHSSGTLAQAAVEDDEHGTRKTEAIMGLDFGTSCCILFRLTRLVISAHLRFSPQVGWSARSRCDPAR